MSPPPPEGSAAADAAFGARTPPAMPVPRPPARRWWPRLPAFLGPAYLVAVGYVDPGNWATDLAAGSAHGSALLWVVLLAGAMAMLLQVLASRLGLVTGRDLAQHCRARSSRTSALAQWLLAELAICAADLAEVIGMAIALQLLLGLPLLAGVVLTAFDAVLLLALQRRQRRLEALIVVLLAVVLGCLAVTLAWSAPSWPTIARGLRPDPALLHDRGALFLAAGLLGATVMPHNLYLHSALLRGAAGSRPLQPALRGAMLDTVVALTIAAAINATILITAAAVFHGHGLHTVTELQQAARLMSPLLGSAAASTLFALALLAAGQSSTLTATLAGQVVMEGFVALRLPAWQRRLATRAIAVLPAIGVIALTGERHVGALLVASQVALSLQLPFAMLPLLRLTSDARVMGRHVNPLWLTLAAWAVALVVIALNAALLLQLLRG
jgi:manganese transport protein